MCRERCEGARGGVGGPGDDGKPVVSALTVGTLHSTIALSAKTRHLVPMAVVCKGEEIGRTRLYEGQGRRPVKVATSVDNVAAREKFLGLVANADSISRMRKAG